MMLEDDLKLLAGNEFFWAALEDIRQSYMRAMKQAGVDDHIIADILDTVENDVCNHYGD